MINAVICPLSPVDPNSEHDEDVGWADMSQAPIQAEGRSAVAAAGDVVDDVIDCEEDVEVQVHMWLWQRLAVGKGGFEWWK